MAKICKKCCGIIQEKDQFCMHCGTPVEKTDSSREPTREQKQDEKTEVLSFGQWLLVLVLLSIPVVNIILAVIWSISSGTNHNKRNFSRAWLTLTVIAMVIGGVIAAAAAFFVISTPVPEPAYPYEHHIEYSSPPAEFIDNFLSEQNEI